MQTSHAPIALLVGAGWRNRTPIPGLEGRCSTIELHPHRANRFRPVAPPPSVLRHIPRTWYGRHLLLMLLLQYQQGGRLPSRLIGNLSICRNRLSCWLRPSTGSGFCPSQGGITDTPDFFQSSTRCNPPGRLLVVCYYAKRGFRLTVSGVPLHFSRWPKRSSTSGKPSHCFSG